MDISALSEDKFNAADWINSNYKKYVEEVGETVAASSAAEAADSDSTALEFINSYVSKLQLYVQQVNYAVEDTSQQLVASMPRVIREARTLQADVEQLQQRMHHMRAEVAAVQEETGGCMATLERLNTLQTKLQAAKESLQESDGWGNLLGELEDCFERNDLKGVCEKLVSLQKSLQAQEQLPGHAERQTQVEDFKNRLEALASPSVVQCFAEGNVEQAQHYVSIFEGIQRLPQLQQYYRAVQKNALQQQWKQTLELQSTESTSQQQQFLALFYDQLLEHCQRQVKWCTVVFADNRGQTQPFVIMAELLPALQPTRDAHILQLLKTSNERLELLEQYAQANHTFVLHLNAFLEQACIELPEQIRNQLGESVYEYFYKFIQQYPRLEETQLSTQVDRLIVSQTSVSDSVRHLDDSSRKLFDWLTEACKRCANITSDLALCKLIALLGGIFKRMLDNFAKTQRQLGLSMGVGTDNWNMLQYTMSLLQCLSDFQLKLNRFEKSLHERMDMDISALSEDKFNAADWINSNYKKYVEEVGETVAASSAAEAADSDSTALEFINSYVSKLQLYVQQVNYAVEDTSQQLVASMPRVIREARTLQADVEQLQQRMHHMRAEVAAVQEETGGCMATLERLNTLQTKLQAAKESLQESDGWGNLLGELEDCFERNDLKGVCEKLVSLQKSLQAQEQLPGHAERQTQVEDFKNRLEALASPSVVQCFAEGNVEQAQHYVSIFEGIQRLPQLQQYYRAVQKNALQQQWKQTLELQSTESTSQQQQFLALFYDQLLEHCQRQVKWCTVVFADNRGQTQPFVIMAELLPALQPTRDAHILQLLKTSNERLELLEQYAQANHTFVLHLNAFLEQACIELPEQIRNQLGESVYEYFYKFIQQYPRLEETQLSTQVDRLIVSQTSVSDSVRHLDDSSRKLFDWLTEACKRCANITSDLALCKLIALLGGIFKRMLDNFAKTQRQLGLSMGVGTDNWNMLQYTMSLLQCLSDFQLKLNRFEKSLHERMVSLADKLNTGAKANAISIYDTYERAEQKRLLATIADYQQKRAEATSSQVLSQGIFTSIYEALKSHFTDTHDIALNILLQPIEVHLANIQPPVDVGANSPVAVDMPSFSFAPQECITQIGQYLLTLPQHLEPLLLSPSPLLKQALEMCNVKYTQAIPCADILLSLVVEQCCHLYQSQVLQIKSLQAAAAKQLAVDIEYLSNVVEELGLSISVHLSQILTLLKAAPENYLTLSSGCEPRLVTAIRQMRNIISTQ